MGAEPIFFVVDASVATAWAFEDETTAYTEAVLDALTESKAVVPSVWPLEVGNALVVAERRGRMNEAETVRFLALLRQLPIVVEAEPLERLLGEVVRLAREQALSSYDAAYLDLAMRLGVPLATQAERLREAASRCGVKVLEA